MEDVLVKATAGDARIYAVTTTHLTQHMNEIHHCTPLAAAALGRTAAGALLLAATMKAGEAVTVRFKGDGPLGQVMADARDYQVRGFVMHPEVMLPPKNGKLDVGGGVGHYGVVTVTRCPLQGEPFTGVSTLKSGEIAADFTRYLAVSEQTPSSVALGVLIEKDGSVAVSGGYFVQLLPDASEETIKTLEDNILTLPYVTELLQTGLDAEGMIRKVAKGCRWKSWNPILFPSTAAAAGKRWPGCSAVCLRKTLKRSSRIPRPKSTASTATNPTYSPSRN